MRLAREDLQAARAMLDRDDIATRIACFHAQQAAEKAIKSRLVRGGIAFANTHDLVVLRELLPAELKRRIDVDDAKDLSVWAVQGRYPGDVPEATRAEALMAVESASRIVGSRPPARRDQERPS
jgi:HEPN domain-containing protein